MLARVRMPRCLETFRLVGFGSLDDLGYGAFALLKFMEDAEAHRFGEHFEAAGDELENLQRNLICAEG